MHFGGAAPRWLTVRNDSDETIPAYGVLRVTGSVTLVTLEDDERRRVITVDKPDGTEQILLINGHREIPAPDEDGKRFFGQATPGPAEVLYDDAQTPTLREHWGPAEDSWELVQDQPGAVVIGTAHDGRVMVALTSLAGSYACLSGDGTLTVTSSAWTKLTILTDEPAEPFGLTTGSSQVTILRDGFYHVAFFASVQSATIDADSPDNSSPELSLFRNGAQHHAEIGSQIRLKSSSARGVAFCGIVECVAGDVLDVRTRHQANEVQRVAITHGGSPPTGGSFTLTFDGQTTGAIAWNANAAAVQTALEALSNIDAGDVTCTGGALPNTPVDCEFTGQYAGDNVPEMTCVSSLTGGSSPVAGVTTLSGPDDLIFDQCILTITGLSGPVPEE